MQLRQVDNIWVLRLATTVSMLWITVLLGAYFASVPVTAFTVKVLYIVGVALAGAAYVSSLTTLFTGAGGNGMKASPGTVLVVDTTPAKEAFGCNAITRTPD